MDNGSEDKTLEITKNYTNKIFKFENNNYAVFRNKAFEKSSGDWILYVDADERVSLELKEEIDKLITDNEFSAYAISRRNIIFGQEVKYGPFWPDWVIRLIRRKDFVGWIGEIHEYPKFSGKLGYCMNSLIHLTHRDIDQIVLKSLEWSKIDAKLRLDVRHPKMNEWRLLRIFISEMFNQGILRKGFLNGTIGTMDALLQTFSLLITYIRLWQMQQKKPLSEIYEDLDKRLINDHFKYPSL